MLSLPPAEREALLRGLSPSDRAALDYRWEAWARPKQQPPPEPWQVWLIKAGRGFGKTRCGAELVRQWAPLNDLTNIIGATADDARDIMIEGESGLLSVCPEAERPEYLPSKRQLRWPSGARSLIFTADEPDRLRGKQHRKLWCDELASWRYPESWDQAMLGLRIGSNPQAVVTTTPRPTKVIRELMRLPGTIVTSGTTYENRDNLARTFFERIITKYEGTRLGRQELNAELLEDVPGALWKREWLEAGRVTKAPELSRVVVALDPSATAGGDEAGIVAAGIGPCTCKGAPEDHVFILDDASVQAKPEAWAAAAVTAYHKFRADCLVAEDNNGGEMVSVTIGTVPNAPPVKRIHASRGKLTRAEPAAMLYEQGKAHHVGCFPALEDELCTFDATEGQRSPNRLDALVWAVTELAVGGLPSFSWL